MNSKRSYLDTVNEGRQRRPSTTLEQITESLHNLESRLSRSREALDEFSREPGDAGQTRYTSALDIDRAFREREALRPRAPEPQTRQPASDPSYQSLPREFDRIREQEEGIASASRIAGELKGLRDDLRQQMASNMHNEFAALRSDLGRMLDSNGDAAVPASSLTAEIDRISRAVHLLAERTDDNGLNALRAEIAQVRGALDTLAREETVRSSNERWDEFDRRWSAFENRVDTRQTQHDPELAALAERLQTISDAVNNLPESLSLRSLEEKVRTLAGALEHFVSQHERQAPEMFHLIEERLDEISRAIVASTAAAQSPVLDPEPFQRIEARISALARQIDEVVEDRPSAEIIERLNTLTQRVDDLAAQGKFPEQAMELLSQQVVAIAKKIDSTPADAERKAILASIDQRFDLLSSMIERRQADAIEQGNLMFRDLGRRLDEVAARIDMRPAELFDPAPVINAIDARFADLADRLARSRAETGGDAIRGLEERLENISARIDANAAKFAGIDPDLIGSLESQVAALTGHLNRPSVELPELDDIGPRLNELEQAIAGSRESILQAAWQAAENAVRTFDGSQMHTAAVTGLAQDLRALESLTRRSDERNTKTFEAIHDTLIKIVDRLGSLETAEPQADRARVKTAMARLVELDSTPPLHPEPAEGGLAAALQTSVNAPKPAAANPRSPAQAAAEAAIAAIGSEIAEERPAPPRPKSLFSGLTRALGRKETASAAKTDVAAEPQTVANPVAEAALDEPLDPKIANRPLAPGSGTPDLNAIMKRVREEREQSGKSAGNDAAKADFIAAARRAAQAAAAEAETTKRGNGAPREARGMKIGDVFRRHRKPILMAASAVTVALAGLQVGRSYLGDSEETAATSTPFVAGKLPQKAAVDAPHASSPNQPPARTASNAAVPASKTSSSETARTAQPSITAAASPKAAEAAPSGQTVIAKAPKAAQPMPQAVPVDVTAKTSDSGAPTAAATPTAKGPIAVAAPAGKSAIRSPGIPAEAGPTTLREAAQAGDAKALFELGARYADGRGVKADLKQASAWYERSAELGFAPAQYRVANLYEKALGVERDIAKAKIWYQRAAEQGNASAMHNLAVLYAMGADGTTNNESAVRWFRSAADLGVKDSQFNLGILAAKGVGMPQNLEDSYKWFALAAKAGDGDAAAKRDEIAKSLRPQQLEKARAAVELWKAKPVDPETNSVEIPGSWRESSGTTASIDIKKAIGNIQRILTKNGYDAGGTDGVMGEKTKNAIIAFQTDNRLAPTGQIDEKLVRALIARK